MENRRYEKSQNSTSTVFFVRHLEHSSTAPKKLAFRSRSRSREKLRDDANHSKKIMKKEKRGFRSRSRSREKLRDDAKNSKNEIVKKENRAFRSRSRSREKRKYDFKNSEKRNLSLKESLKKEESSHISKENTSNEVVCENKCAVKEEVKTDVSLPLSNVNDLPFNKDNNEKRTAKYAYVTLVFGDRFYIPPALVLAFSLKRFKCDTIDIVCMITPEMSSERSVLSNYFDRVIEVPYLCKATARGTTVHYQRYYSFMDKLYTKWRCLELIEYEKVLFLDADMYAVGDPKEVFQFTTPGGVLLNGYSQRLGGYFPDFYGKLEAGLSYKLTLTTNNIIPTAQCVLLKPSLEDTKRLASILQDCDVVELKPFKGYGGDEIVLAKLYPNWTHIGVAYCYDWSFNSCKVQTYHLKSGFKPIIMTARGANKVWTKDAPEYEDEKLWFNIAKEMPEFETFKKYKSCS